MTQQELQAWVLAFTGKSDRTGLARLVDPHIGGVNPVVGTTREVIWAAGGPLAYPNTAGEQVEVISASANDTAGGTGLRTIRLDYLTPDGLEVSVDATMNGVGAVAFPTLDVAWIQRAYGLTFGALGCTAGTVTIRTVAGATTVEALMAGARASSSARYRVPAGRDLLLWGFRTKTDPGDGAIFWLEHNFDGYDAAGDPIFLASTRPIWQVQTTDELHINEPVPPLWLPAATRIECATIRTGTANATVACFLHALEVLR